MKDLTRLRTFPLYQFYFQLSGMEKLLFFVLFACIIGLCGGILYSYDNPTQWTMDVTEVTSAEKHEVTVREVHANYRTLSLPMEGFSEWVKYAAGPLLPKDWMIIGFVLMQVLGWSVLFAAATSVQNWVYFPLSALFLMNISLGQGQEVFGMSMIPSVAIVLAVFGGLSALFRFEVLKVSLPLRVLIFLALNGALHGFAFYTGGAEGLHQSVGWSFMVLGALVIIYLFFIGNDLTNLLVFSTTNFKNRKRRVGPWGLIYLYLPILLLEFMIFQKEANFNFFPIDWLPVKPFHLLVLVSLLTVGLSQNLWPAVKHFVERNGALTLGIAAFVVIALSTILYNMLAGEVIFVDSIERHTIVFLFLTGLFHIAYILLNFWHYLKQKVNIYFLMMLPQRLMYFFVIMGSVLLAWAMEAKDQSVTPKIFISTAHDHLADYYYLLGDKEIADAEYTQSYLNAIGNPKSHYNLGAMYAGNRDYRDFCFERFEAAQEYQPFPKAALNAGNLLYGFGDFNGARLTYQDFLRKNDDPLVANNLALAFMEAGKADSSITYLKRALRQTPDNSGLYSNLGKVYMQYDKIAEARKFFRAGITQQTISPAAVTNALLFNQTMNDTLPVPDHVWEMESVKKDQFPLYNYLLLLAKRRDVARAKAMLGTMPDKELLAEPMFLEGMLMFDEGRFDDGLSRMEFIAANFGQYAKYAHHFLGLKFFEEGVPEVAAEYFRKAADAGLTADHLNAVRMEIDAGNHDYAFNQLNLVRALYEELWEPASIEENMLLYAYGQGDFTANTWDPSVLPFDDQVRISLYAGVAGNYIPALENFRRIITLDSSTIVPYLEMGRIYIRNKDTLALENLEYGLTFDPDNLPLRVELARAYMLVGRTGDAHALSDKLVQENDGNFDVRLVRAETNLARKDTAKALPILVQLNKEKPLNKPVLRQLGAVYKAQGNADDGYQLFYDAVQLNDRNGDLWYYMAVFAKLMGELTVEDAGFAALRAIGFTRDPARKLAIASEFEKEIAAYSASLE